MAEIPNTENAEGKVIKGEPFSVKVDRQKNSKGITRGGHKSKEGISRYRCKVLPQIAVDFIAKKKLKFYTSKRDKAITMDEYGNCWVAKEDFDRFTEWIGVVENIYHSYKVEEHVRKTS